MADRLPNYHIEIKRLKADLSQNKANVERNELRVMEMRIEADTLEENNALMRDEATKIAAKIIELEKVHGKGE